MYEFAKLTESQVADLGKELRSAAADAAGLQDAAAKVVRFLFENLTDSDGNTVNAMIRFFKVHPYSKLDFELQTYVRGFLMAYSGPGSNPPPDSVLPCLTLLASMADLEALTRRRKSMPIVDAGVMAGIPMLNRLFGQFGIDLELLGQPDSAGMQELSTQTLNTFYVPEALGSPYVPGQEAFVAAFGVKSALGFGGVFPNGEAFFLILFPRVSIPADVASAIRNLSASVKEAVAPFVGDQISGV